MRLLYSSLAFFLLHVASAASDDKKPLKPCTIHSPHSERFFDLNPIAVLPHEEGKPVHKDDRTESWHAKGHDYNTNFTINFCAPVVEELEDVVGVESSLWKNVSAYYTKGGKTYSIGQANTELVFRGRKLVLNYTDGSPCDISSSKRSLFPRQLDDLPSDPRDDDDEDEDEDPPSESTEKKRRKSTIFSLLCEKDPLAPKTTVSFVGASPDECTYFFEARTAAACGGVEIEQQTLSPGGVFGVIALIAILVYLIGGCVYQRTVIHQRGWRQLPNYSMWAAIAGFFSDIFIILTSSCARLLPSRRGYSRVSLNGNGRGRGRDPDAENRLIDNLDESWDD
ncbi:mannose 6-phosphate receptor domain-containing protein [Patellaria atrata CBS 101060]|uniref:Mannose 6-phosphate receptor domain-containing protein n=1 Tax=Patellaria atrata CBS 101060 TaxID=1346257 RepID=A0A9P4S8A8_9PEZI|nr:mannose 6-phosphate receptor domain-containing protein [Patellaria atrata CBS 101060]